MRTRHQSIVIARRVRHESEFWARGLPRDAVFEIGSITKTFTGTLLADMAREGLVALDDPVAKHLPVAPPVNGREITLEDLATHRSGLPRLPAGLPRVAYTRERKDPYANVDMLKAIPATRPKRPPGQKTVYSNYGMGLLGFALAHRAGMSYGALVRERITGPLGMHDTGLDTPGLITGHTWRGKPTPPWNLNQLAGAGGLRSTAADLLTYLAADTPAIRDARRPRAKLGRAQVGLAWIILPDGTVFHDGGTGGFRSFAGFNPATGTAVVVLASQARSTTRLGLKLLR